MTTNRRDFLKTSAAASGVAVLSMYVPGFGGQEAQAAGSLHTPNVWVHIADDNTITLLSHMSEMGQGVHTSLPMLIRRGTERRRELRPGCDCACESCVRERPARCTDHRWFHRHS